MAVDHAFLHEGTTPGGSLSLITAYSFQPATGASMTLLSLSSSRMLLPCPGNAHFNGQWKLVGPYPLGSGDELDKPPWLYGPNFQLGHRLSSFDSHHCVS